MSKRIFQHPTEAAGSKKYWRSLDQLAETPHFTSWLEREFPQGAAELKGGEVSRRHFMKIMGASTALAGLVGCRRPEKHLVPFTRSAEWTIPGKPVFYATSMPTRRGAIPLVVTTHDGRPTKIEGNPLVGSGKGGTDIWAQASVLDLYDPERSQRFLASGKPSDETTFMAELDRVVAEVAGKNGAGLAFLVEKKASPTRNRLRKLIADQLPDAHWVTYEATGSDTPEEAAKVAFGERYTLRPRLEKADVILALDRDFLGCVEGDLEGIKSYSKRRKVDAKGGTMNRLYVVEPRYTVTGGMADHRLRLPAGQIGAYALALAAELGVSTSQFADSAPKLGIDEKWISEVAADLKAAAGKALVLVGEQHSTAIQLLVLAINEKLGALNETLVALPPQATESTASLGGLAGEILNKRITHLVIVGGNPSYNAPADLNWADLQKTVPTVIRVGYHEDETSAGAGWHVPLAHYLEAWGDASTADGTLVAVQPMILPLFGGWSENDILARFAGLPKPKGPELVKETFKTLGAGDVFDVAWNKFLHDGFLADSAPAPVRVSYDLGAASAAASTGFTLAEAPTIDGLEVSFVTDVKMDDGRYNNNGWLQELPDPITKLAWDNAALISIATAKELGLSVLGIKKDLGEKKMGVYDREIIEISFADGRTLEIAALIAPGHADHCITLPLGYGRLVVGEVGRHTGVNAYPLRTTAQSYVASGAKVRRTGKFYELAIVQDHYSMEGRYFVRETTLEKYNSEADREYIRKMGMDSHIPENVSLYSNPPLTDPNQWGMAIDLNSCTGCNACVIACQSENNIPIVGKEQVIIGRSMHWMRLDRYFSGDNVDDPEMVVEPMMCQHCENAPCETVCPVNATIHSEDGLNLMAYNRCIGTRYCANNCPFKVRRFNFFDYNQRKVIDHEKGLFSGLHKWNMVSPKGMADTLKMQKNPNVTVRMRGVMEKCTFCIQRIEEARITAKVKAGASKFEGIKEKFQVACQQACPADAIVFGDLKDPESAVSKAKAQDKNYELLKYLNVGTRVTYLAKLRNPNMKMPGAEKIGADPGAHHGGDHQGEHNDNHAAEAEHH